MAETLFYSLKDYSTIKSNVNLENIFEKATLDILQSLALRFGTSVQETTQVQKNYKQDTYKKKGYRKDKEVPDESWEQLRSFKTTVIIEKKEGSEKIMDDIRANLNKMSVKNYDANKANIFQLLDQIQAEDYQKIGQNIFEIASRNKFFSEIYADLYRDCMEKNPAFGAILEDFTKSFTDTMRDIQYVDPNGNYDDFCRYNKKNDERKSMSVFIVNLVKKGVLAKGLLIQIIRDIQDICFAYIDTPGKINEVEETTENLFLLVTQSLTILQGEDGWGLILENIKKVSQFKVKEKASISSRTIFKYMDILEKHIK